MNPRDVIGMFRRRGGGRCIEVGRKIQTYLDDGLDPAAAGRVAAHLDACRRCGLTAAEYERLKAALAATGDDVPADAIERLQRLAADLAAGER